MTPGQVRLPKQALDNLSHQAAQHLPAVIQPVGTYHFDTPGVADQFTSTPGVADYFVYDMNSPVLSSAVWDQITGFENGVDRLVLVNWDPAVHTTWGYSAANFDMHIGYGPANENSQDVALVTFVGVSDVLSFAFYANDPFAT